MNLIDHRNINTGTFVRFINMPNSGTAYRIYSIQPPQNITRASDDK